MARWPLAALPLLLLALGGCAGPAAGPSAGLPSAAPAPFHVDREGDLLPNGTSGEWHWRVDPGFRTFQVHLFLAEMQVAPAHAERDIHYALVGDGPGHHTDESDERAATGLEATVGSGCILCDDSGFPGQWSFTLAIGASAAHYRLHIETTY